MAGRPRVSDADYRSRFEGLTFGRRTLRRVINIDRSERHVVLHVAVECKCGSATTMRIQPSGRNISPTCVLCRPKRRSPPKYYSERLGALREAGDRCPEVWRDKHGSVRAASELAGLLGPLSLNEVAGLMGLTRERIRQIEAGALRKLRERWAGDGRDMLRELDSRQAGIWEQAALNAPGEI